MGLDEEQITLAASITSGMGSAGNVLLFLSQIPLMIRIIKEGDSTKFSYLPSITQLWTMSLWGAYTIWVLPTVQLYVANFSGVIIPLVYLIVFFIYEPRWRARAQIVALALATMGFAFGLYGGLFASGHPNATGIAGGVTAAVNVSFHASPLKQLYVAVKELDLKRVPVLLSTVQLVQSSVWIIAGGFLRDYFIMGVNGSGLFFAILQLSVIAYIRHKRARVGATAALSPSSDGSGAVDSVDSSKATLIEVKASPSAADDGADGAAAAASEQPAGAAAAAESTAAVAAEAEGLEGGPSP